MITTVSFIVPVRNDAARLDTCLRSIAAVVRQRNDIEIVVVDNGSSDRSPEVAVQHGATLLVIDRLPVAELRNRGAAASTGSILAFVDADNEITAGWLEAVEANLAESSVGATGALYKPPRRGTWVQHAYGQLRGQTLDRAEVDWLSSGNLAVRRDVFERVRGFDTSLEACEDVDLCHRIRAAGFRIVGDARIESIHHGDPVTIGALFRSELWRGRDNLKVSFRRPIMWRSVPSAILPVVDAVLLVVGVSGIIAWLGGWTAGLRTSAIAATLFGGGAGLRVLRASTRDGHRGAVIQAFVVACVYNVARAFALFAKAPHRSVRSKTVPTAAS